MQLEPELEPAPVPQALLEAIASGTMLQDQGPVKTVKSTYTGKTVAVRSDDPNDSEPASLYIVTEWIGDAQTLETAWTTLEETDKDHIVAQIQSILRALRSLPVPQPSYIGSVGHLPCADPLLRGVGPFNDRQGCIEAYSVAAKPCFRGHYISIIERLLKRVDNYRIVLTHGDLAWSNILISQSTIGASWEVAALIDWENSGWYPEHWEYTMLLASVKWKSDWALRAQSLLEHQYDEDFLLDSRLRFYHRL